MEGSIELKKLLNANKRKQALINFFNKNRGSAIFIFSLIIILVISFFGYQIYQKFNQEKLSSALYQSLMSQQDLQSSKKNLKEIYESKKAASDVKSLASLRYATFLLDEDNKAEAAKVYLKISECFFCNSYLKELSSLLLVKVWVSNDEEIKKPDLLSRIKKVEDRSKILKSYIAEQRAILQMKKNNFEESYKIFEFIFNDPNSAKATKLRSSSNMKILLSKGYNPESAKSKSIKGE